MGILADLLIFKHEQSRTITPENPSGASGQAAKTASHLGPSRKGRPCVAIQAGQTLELVNIQAAGVIRHIWLTVPTATASGSFVLRDLVLRMYWDGESEPSVECPLGDFFCCGFGTPCRVNSLPIAVNPTLGMNCYFQMPFKKSARITLTNEHPQTIENVFYAFDYALTEPKSTEQLYFHAKWNRQAVNQKGQDYLVLDNLIGHGYYVGTYLAVCALERYWWGEGEFKFYLDHDDQFPTITSTGTEDYFGGAWAFNHQESGQLPVAETYSSLFSGYPFQSKHDHTRDNYHDDSPHAFGNDALPMHGLYRWHLLDPIAFQRQLRVAYQDLGNDDRQLFERQDDIASVAYWYQSEPHRPFEPLLARQARQPR
jgi:hypothetical protein